MSLTLLSPLIPTGRELTALLVVVSFSAGLNVYATVGMLGLLGRYNVLQLPDSLHILQDWKIIAVCAVLFLLEFVGDKIPVFDLLWNAAHTFVRVPVAAYLAYAATSQLPQWEQLAATFAGGLIALAAHGGKTAARAAVTHSPEPFSNFALSLSEDALVILLMWIVTQHPYVASIIVIVALCVIVILLRFVLRALRTLFSDAERALAASATKI
ncbi:MAG: DUF4126 domain-containing protein [Candidatus Acidiferrales bacterium]